MDLVVLSEVRWGYFRTRKQFLLSRFPDSWRVFFAQPPAFGADDPWTPRRERNVTYFTIPFLKPGLYTLTVEMSGFQTHTRKDMTLEVGQTAESVEVTADSEAAISYVTTSVGGVINNMKAK